VDLLDWVGLAATTAGAALLYTLTGFGFAVLAAPLFLLFVDPSRAIQLVIIISTALSLVALPALWRALGLVAFQHADPVLVRALVGAMILGFAVFLEWRRRAPEKLRGRFGMAGPPVVIYLLLAGAPPRTVRATLLSFFALAYAMTLATHAVTVGIPNRTWLSAWILIPFAFLGGLAGRPLGDRLGADAFAILAIILLGAAGIYTLAAAAVFAVPKP